MNNNDMKVKQTYDEIVYQSKPFLRTHPGHLKSILALCDIKTAPIENARVLEIGCSVGGNIIPLAMHYPDMQIVGIDLSSVQIEKGKAIIEKLGLTNIELIAADINNVNCEQGVFDYIICHGVFSWVPKTVQQNIFRLIATGLSEQGVAIVSYNTYPGWKISDIYRDIALLNDDPNWDAQTRYERMMETYDFLKATVSPNSPLGVALKRDYDKLKSSPPNYMLHEYLEIYNQPIYFKTFVEQLAEHQLTYLADVSFLQQFTKPINMTQEQYEDLKALANGNDIHEEQLKDFVTDRHFRQSIITTSKNCQKLNSTKDEWLTLHVAGNIVKEINDDGSIKYLSNNEELGTDPALQFIASRLCEAKPNTLPVAQLYKEYLDTQPATDEFYAYLAVLVGENRLTLRPHPVVGYLQIDEKPYLPIGYRILAKHLLDNDDIRMGSPTHHAMDFEFVHLLIMTLLDGEKTQDKIVAQLIQMVETGVISLTTNDGSEMSQEAIQGYFKNVVLDTLGFLRFYCFLQPTPTVEQLPSTEDEMPTEQENKASPKKDKQPKATTKKKKKTEKTIKKGKNTKRSKKTM